MAISYPLTLPTVTGISAIELRTVNAVVNSRSPFTFSGQTFAYPGQMWQADVTLPRMHRDSAEEWVAWLVSLRGQFGTFLLGDPLGATPRGVATGNPVVDGSGQTGGELSITGATPNVSSWLKVGDYVQLGAASSARLHKVLKSVGTDASGAAVLDLWPHIRTPPVSGSAVVLNNAQGVFRLASNEQLWSINEVSHYGITFGAMEEV